MLRSLADAHFASLAITIISTCQDETGSSNAPVVAGRETNDRLIASEMPPMLLQTDTNDVEEMLLDEGEDDVLGRPTSLAPRSPLFIAARKRFSINPLTFSRGNKKFSRGNTKSETPVTEIKKPDAKKQCAAQKSLNKMGPGVLLAKWSNAIIKLIMSSILLLIVMSYFITVSELIGR